MAQEDNTKVPETGLDISKLNLYGADEEDLRAIRDAQQKGVEALENRYSQPNWWKVAAGFAKPQLGGFLASFGSAADAYGDTVEKQRAQQMPIAQMKAQIEQSNLLLRNQQKANSMVAEWRASGTPLTPALVGEVNRLAPGSAVAKSLSDELASRQANQQNAINAIELGRKTTPGFTPSGDLLEAAGIGGGNRPSAQPGETETPPSAGGAGSMSGQDFADRVIKPLSAPPGKTTPGSTASGPYDMLKGTAQDLKKRYNISGDYGTDDATNRQYVDAYNSDVAKTLNDSKLDSSARNYRTLWWFGTGDGTKILKSDPSTPIGDIIKDPSTLKNNGLSADMPVGQVLSKIDHNLWGSRVNPSTQIGAAGARASQGQKQANESDWGAPNESIKVSPPKLNPNLPPAAQQEQLVEQTKESRNALTEISNFTSDPNFTNRVSNLKNIGSMLGDKEVRDWIRRAAPNQVASIVRSAATSNSAPDFIANSIKESNLISPSDSPELVGKVQSYLNALAKEQLYTNNLVNNPTNSKYHLELQSTINGGMQPDAAMKQVMYELHNMQRVALTPHILQPYADSGYSIPQMYDSPRYKSYIADWNKVHEQLPNYATRYSVPVLFTHPQAYTGGFDYRKLKKEQ